MRLQMVPLTRFRSEGSFALKRTFIALSHGLLAPKKTI
ncbi:hypothetical protein ACUW9K_000339 [Corynebacterium hesseae]